ncbi:hypothetical protein GM921_17165 [Pedobacter sp. LMG 31464]|uniref:Uncharacterized protein n=1 Tax=Pedobacter planticolens TaxID=2679964 RepID=A0A923E4A6_9SPHI|nr:hypothetical protein [Pedobacter planticolens]MBB2147234.1 hypothetical protein [Pedobacter planticolens]
MINTFIHCKKEFISGYDFVIKNISITPTKKLKLYDIDGKKVSFWNYSIMADEGVSIGDSVYKAPCAKFLYIYKKNGKGEYKEYQKLAPSGLFPYNWFCK